MYIYGVVHDARPKRRPFIYICICIWQCAAGASGRTFYVRMYTCVYIIEHIHVILHTKKSVFVYISWMYVWNMIIRITISVPQAGFKNCKDTLQICIFHYVWIHIVHHAQGFCSLQYAENVSDLYIYIYIYIYIYCGFVTAQWASG